MIWLVNASAGFDGQRGGRSESRVMAKVRTLIVDDEPLARERIRQFLGGEEDLEIVGECEDGLAALEAIREQSPDLVFLDVQMPELGGFEVLSRLDPARMPATQWSAKLRAASPSSPIDCSTL